MAGYLSIPLLVSQTAINTTSAGYNLAEHAAVYAKLFVVGVGTISAGKMVMEESPTKGNAGTWAPIGLELDLTSISGGKTLSVPLNDRAYGEVRARISTGVTGSGGAVSVTLLAVTI